MRFFENRVWSKILGTKREGATRDCRKVQNDEPHDLYSLSKFLWMII
jgi:hypothetical protein